MSVTTKKFLNLWGTILIWKGLFMSIFVAKRPPELYKICNINFMIDIRYCPKKGSFDIDIEFKTQHLLDWSNGSGLPTYHICHPQDEFCIWHFGSKAVLAGRCQESDIDFGKSSFPHNSNFQSFTVWLFYELGSVCWIIDWFERRNKTEGSPLMDVSIFSFQVR